MSEMAVSYAVSVVGWLKDRAACVHPHEMRNRLGTSVLVSVAAAVYNSTTSSQSLLSLNSQTRECKK